MFDFVVIVAYIAVIIGFYFLFVRIVEKDTDVSAGFNTKILCGFAATCVPSTIINIVLYTIKTIVWIATL